MVKRMLPFLLVLCVPLLLASPGLAEPFGLQSLEVSATNRNGSPDVQAGSHPYELTTTFSLNKPEKIENQSVPLEPHFRPAGQGLRDVRFETPPGFVGNPNATPKCGYQEFTDLSGGYNSCPNDTVV